MIFGWAAVLLALLSACQSATVSIGAIDAQKPILIGPVLLLGDAAHGPVEVGERFSGRVTAVATETRRQGDSDELAADFVERMGSRDELTPAMTQALRSRSDGALYLDRLRVVDAVHWTALFLVDKRLQAEGYAFGLPRRRLMEGR